MKAIAKATPLIMPDAAEAAIAAELSDFGIEGRPLSRCVGGTLRENVYAERDCPPFDRVCMDGAAIASTSSRRGVRRYTLQATQAAGRPPLSLQNDESAIEVMTGASVPGGADCVIPLEQYFLTEGGLSLVEPVNDAPFRNVQRRGEDGRQGSLLLEVGTPLGAPEVAIAASAGLGRVRISSQPAFMVISTGDELVEPGEPIAGHQVRRSNAYAVIAALRARGFERVSNDHLRDDEATLAERLALHLATHEAIVLSGGVSMGRLDLVPAVLGSLGVRQVFHRVAQRPGKPMWFGVGPRGQAVFGLPGNPVSTLVCLVRYVIPAIINAMGTCRAPPERIRLARSVEVDLPVVYFLPVAVEFDEWGQPWAGPCPTNTSGDFSGLVGTDGFIELPPGPVSHPKGFLATLYRW